MYIRHLAPFAALAIVVSSTPAPAGVVIVDANKDNTLYESSTGALSNGAGDAIFSGRTNTGALRRALLSFDVASAVPTGATITSVSLTLFVTQGAGGPKEVGLHRALADWGEGASVATPPGGMGGPAAPGDATWLHTSYDDAFWTNPGGDFDAAASQTTMVDTFGSFTWSTSDALVSDAQSWLDDPSGNFGWIIVGDESEFGTSKRFASREASDLEDRPMLMIEYADVPAPGGFALVAAALLPRRRRRPASLA